jgi:hypothetical protein
LYAITFAGVALLISLLQQRWYKENIPLTMLLAFTVTFLGQTLIMVIASTAGLNWFIGEAYKVIFGIALYNCLLVPLTYPFLHRSFTSGLLHQKARFEHEIIQGVRKMEKRDREPYNKRLTGLGIAVVFLFLILTFNLWRLQIAKASYYAELAAGNVMKNVTTPSVRGEIVDSKGVVLVRSVPKFALTLDWIDLQDVNKDWKEVVAKLAAYIKPYWPYANQSVELITEDIFVMIRNQQWESYRPVVILEDVPPDLQAIIAEHSNELPGVSIEPTPVRVYTNNTMLGQVLGYVREISQTEIEQFNQQSEAKGDDYRYTQGTWWANGCGKEL